MWDKELPLRLLKTMPETLESEHLGKMQKLFEADKFKNQLVTDSDLCGSYADFCALCDKNEQFPCAVAYIKYLQSQGENVKIAQSSHGESVTEPAGEVKQDTAAVAEEENTAHQDAVQSEAAAEVQPEETEQESEVHAADETEQHEQAEESVSEKGENAPDENTSAQDGATVGEGSEEKKTRIRIAVVRRVR